MADERVRGKPLPSFSLLGASLQSVNYQSIDLALAPDEARDIVAERVPGVTIREFRDRYEFVSPIGYHLAELSETRLPNGDRGAELTYRTAMISPVAARARRKAEAIREALSDHRYRD